MIIYIYIGKARFRVNKRRRGSDAVPSTGGFADQQLNGRPTVLRPFGKYKKKIENKINTPKEGKKKAIELVYRLNPPRFTIFIHIRC